MADSLLGTYSIDTTDNINYVVNFSIPDNCEYAITGSAGAYTITVTLKRGQFIPSPTFIGCKETLSTTTGTISVEFEQQCHDETLSSRPRIRIEN